MKAKSCPEPCRDETGWYLGLRYMQGSGLRIETADPLPLSVRKASFLYANEVLLQSADWKALLWSWWLALDREGHLVLWIPDCRYHETQTKTRLTLDDLSCFFDDLEGRRLHELDLIDGWAFVVVQKKSGKQRHRTPWRKQPRHILVARFGGIGDVLMASSVLPALKEQGHSISFITHQQGATLLEGNPYLDEIIALPLDETFDSYREKLLSLMAKRFDLFINLTHSIEGELLKQPDRCDYFWSDEQRRANCKESYLARLHRLAGVPPPYRVAFFPHKTERDWAQSYAQETGPFLLWALRGSSVHKWWPYMDEAACQILAHTPFTLVFTGGSDALTLANSLRHKIKRYHGSLQRVRFLVATHGLREIFSLAPLAHGVIGPETGLMHAVSFEKTPKLLFLSHSSKENIGADWINTTCLAPRAACYPCHRLHFDHTHCPQDPLTNAAVCSASLHAERVVHHVRKWAHLLEGERHVRP